MIIIAYSCIALEDNTGASLFPIICKRIGDPIFVFSRRYARNLFKYLAEIVRIIKAQFIRDFIHQVLVGVDKLHGMLDLNLGNII